MVGWCHGAGYYFQCRGVLLIWIIVRQGPFALAVGAGGDVWTFFLSSVVYRLSFLSPSLGGCSTETEILSQRAGKPQTTKQPNPVVSGKRTPVYSCYYVYTKVSDKNACRSIDSYLSTHSTILDSISRRFFVD